MSSDYEFFLIFFAVCSPFIAIVLIKHFFRYRSESKRLDAELRKGADQETISRLIKDVDRLKLRMQVLETIVTDNGYDLQEQFRQLEKQA